MAMPIQSQGILLTMGSGGGGGGGGTVPQFTVTTWASYPPFSLKASMAEKRMANRPPYPIPLPHEFWQ